MSRNQIAVAAMDNGWECTRSGAEFMIWHRRVPMIDRRDEYRVHVYFGPDGDRPTDAYYGPANRQHAMPSVAAGIIEHLVAYGRPS